MAEPAATTVCVEVNGLERRVAAYPWLTAVEFLREQLGLTGTKIGCGAGECGACTVLVDGAPLLACLLLAVELHGTKVITIEGLGAAGLDPLQQAFLDEAGLQCGFCTPGMVLAATAIPQHASDVAIRDALAGNLCRCTGYTKIVAAVRGAGAGT